MSDPRHTQLAEILVQYSCNLQEGDKVLIEAIDIPHRFTSELVRVASEAGALPFVTLKNQSVWRALQMAGSSEQMRLIAEIERGLIIRAAETAGWNQSRTAEILGIKRDKLRYRMKIHDLHEAATIEP